MIATPRRRPECYDYDRQVDGYGLSRGMVWYCTIPLNDTLYEKNKKNDEDFLAYEIFMM